MAARAYKRVQWYPEGPSRTKQSFAKECDINTILAKYTKTGLLEHVKTYQGYYGELPDAVDFQANLNAVIAAQAAFETLPATIRTKFFNDPAQFLAFVDDPDNAEEMVTLGLRDKPHPSATAPEASTEPPKSSKGEGDQTKPADSPPAS